MAISLLYLENRQSHAEPLSERIPYHLSLDRSFSYICADVNKQKSFLSVVSALTDDKDEILYRQEIIKDFENHPALLEQMIPLASRFEELRIAQKTAGKDKYRLNAMGTASPASSKNILETQALCTKRALLYIKEFGELLEKYVLQSRGLRKLQSACKEVYEHPDFTKLLLFCAKYECVSAGRFWNFRFSLNSEGRIGEYALLDHAYIHVTEHAIKRKGFSFFKKEEKPNYPCCRVGSAQSGLFETLAVSALTDLSGLFGKISEQIFAKFASIGRDLVFYNVALMYIKTLEEKKVPICYPNFSNHQGTRIKNLYDLYLLMTKSGFENVVPNDFMMEPSEGGLLVFGNNGSGKTVYLRSIGTMQILAQAGLPIPCERTEIAVVSQLATQFSEAEKEFCEGNDAGRFEQEVRELATMIDTLKEGALVFLNETFQSTAYAEGAEGLYHLLKYFSNVHIRWILVSHLHRLEEMFDGDEIAVLHTTEGHKVC